MLLLCLTLSGFVMDIFVARRPNMIAFETPIFKDWDMNGF